MEGKWEATIHLLPNIEFMEMHSIQSNVLDNGLPQHNIPWRSETGRVSHKANSVVIMRDPYRIGPWIVKDFASTGQN